MRERVLESSLHLYQPPRYRASDGSWHESYANALSQSAAEIALDPASVLSLLSFHFVCGERTLIREIRRAPWLSSVNGNEDPVLSPIPPHGLRWQSFDAIADELGRRLCDEALRVCQGRREVYVLLSGGLDSRIVAGTLSKLVREGRLPIKPVALTWGLTDSRDYAYAREAARILGLEWQHVEFGPEHLRENVTDTAELLGALVSPIHLHRMTWFRSVAKDALVLAGNYGDMVGRAEFSGKRLLELGFLKPSNAFGLMRPEVLETAREDLQADLAALHARSPDQPKYVLCEHEMHGHYTRSLIAHAMSVVNQFCSVYQMFTDPNVYSYMWSLHPSLRGDEVYAELLPRLHPELGRVPWARTNKALRGPTRGAQHGLRRDFHDYASWVSAPLWEELARASDVDWCASTGLFDADRVRNLARSARESDTSSVQLQGRTPFEILVWLACFRRFVEWAEERGKRVRLDPAAVRPAARGVVVPIEPQSRVRRALRSSPVLFRVVRSIRQRVLRYGARIRYRPTS